MEHNKKFATDIINSGVVDKIYFNMTNGLYWKLFNYDLVSDKNTGLIRIQSNHAHKIKKVLQPLSEEFYFELMTKKVILLIDGSNRDFNCSDAFKKTLPLMIMMYNKFLDIDFKNRVEPNFMTVNHHDIVFERFPKECYIDTKQLYLREENKVDYLKRFYLPNQERRGAVVLNVGPSKVIDRNYIESLEDLKRWQTEFPNDCIILTYTESPFHWDDITYEKIITDFPELKNIPFC